MFEPCFTLLISFSRKLYDFLCSLVMISQNCLWFESLLLVSSCRCFMLWFMLIMLLPFKFPKVYVSFFYSWQNFLLENFRHNQSIPTWLPSFWAEALLFHLLWPLSHVVASSTRLLLWVSRPLARTAREWSTNIPETLQPCVFYARSQVCVIRSLRSSTQI